MKYSNRDVEIKLEKLTQLKYQFEDSFINALNKQNDISIRTEFFVGAQISIIQAQQLIDELNEDKERFPEEISSLPYALKQETNFNYAVKRFSNVRNKIAMSCTVH